MVSGRMGFLFTKTKVLSSTLITAITDTDLCTFIHSWNKISSAGNLSIGDVMSSNRCYKVNENRIRG